MKIAILRENLRRNMVFHRCFSDWDIPRSNCALRAWKKWSKQERCILGSTEKREREREVSATFVFTAMRTQCTRHISHFFCHLPFMRLATTAIELYGLTRYENHRQQQQQRRRRQRQRRRRRQWHEPGAQMQTQRWSDGGGRVSRARARARRTSICTLGRLAGR